MQEGSGSAPRHHPGIAESGPFGRMLLATAKWFAFTGGLIFTGLVIMSMCRAANRRPAGATPLPC